LRDPEFGIEVALLNGELPGAGGRIECGGGRCRRAGGDGEHGRQQ
jgi:hypothetical protein